MREAFKNKRPFGGLFLVQAMKMACVCGFLALLGNLQPAAAQPILIDFGAGAAPTDVFDDSEGRYWNNLVDNASQGSSNTGSLPDPLVYAEDGSPSEIYLSMISRFTGANTAGTTGSALFPSDATSDTLYGNVELWQGLANILPSFKLSGLDAAKLYRFTFYASRMGAGGDSRETRYTVTGTNTSFADLQVSENVDEVAVVSGISPASTGEVTISLSPTANNNNAYHFIYLGVLMLEEDDTPPVTAVSFQTEPADQSVEETRPVSFAATVQGSPPFTVAWLKDGELIAGADQLTYTIPSAAMSLNGARYSVRVGNASNTVTSRQAVLTVVKDDSPPALTSADIIDGTSFRLHFNEPLDQATAGDASRYTAANAGGSVVVLTSEVQENGASVILSLDEALNGAVIFTALGVKDLAGNSTPATTQITINVPVPDPNLFFFDFGGGDTTTLGPGNNDPIHLWNNIGTAVAATEGGSLIGVVNSTGEPTEITLTTVSRFNAINTNGTVDATAPFPANATRDSFYGNTASFNNLSDITPVFKMSGLDTSKTYDFVFYASRIGAGGDNRETRYTVTGANEKFADLNVAENISEVASVAGISPDESNEITIALTPTENNTNPNRFIYLGVMVMTVKDASVPEALVMLPPSVSNGKIILDWTGNGILQWSATLKETEWQPVTPRPTPPYSEDLLPAGARYFRLTPP